MKKLTPLGDRIIVRREEAPDKIGNILLPDNAKEKPRRGEVLSVGAGRWNEGTQPPMRLTMAVKVGQVVLFGAYAGTEVEVEGEKLLILTESDVLATLDDVKK